MVSNFLARLPSPFGPSAARLALVLPSLAPLPPSLPPPLAGHADVAPLADHSAGLTAFAPAA